MEEMDGSKSWEKFYNVCPLWGYLFRETQDPDAEWPRGLRWEMGRLFFRERLCIPMCLQKPFIRENPCVPRTRGWEAVVGTNVVNQRVGSGGGGTSVYHECVKAV